MNEVNNGCSDLFDGFSPVSMENLKMIEGGLNVSRFVEKVIDAAKTAADVGNSVILTLALFPYGISRFQVPPT